MTTTPRAFRLVALFAGLWLLASSAVALAATPAGRRTPDWIGGTDQFVAGLAPAGPSVQQLVPAARELRLTVIRRAQAGRDYGVRLWIRETTGAPIDVRLGLAGRRGGRSLSAPARITTYWQTLGVSLRVPAAGPLVLSLAPVRGGWPARMRVQIAGMQDTGLSPSVTARLAGTREVTLNGTAFNPRGWVYFPVPIGHPGFYAGTVDPATCQADAQLIGAEGANIVQIPLTSTYGTTLPQCLDAFWARGIGVAWLFDMGTFEGDAGTLAAQQARLQVLIDAVKSAPATEFYLIGNEVDNRGANPAACFFDNAAGTCSNGPSGQLNSFAQEAHSLDPDHLVGTKVCCHYAASTPQSPCGAPTAINPSNVPAVDFWGLDAYPSLGFGSYLSCVAQADPTRPVLVTEFGDTHWLCQPPMLLSPGGPYRNNVTASCAYPASAEDQADQAYANQQMWQSLIANEATPADPQGAVFGGTTFMYSDLWWFSLGDFFYPVGTPVTHDVNASNGIPCYPSNWCAPEWWGSTYAQLPWQAGQPRITTADFTALGELWTGAVFPVVSDAAIDQVGACTARLSWVTSEPATSRVDYGVVRLVEADGQIESDNTTYPHYRERSNFVTQHVVHLSNLLPNTTYRVVVRGFDRLGRTDAAIPMQFTTTLGTC